MNFIKNDNDSDNSSNTNDNSSNIITQSDLFNKIKVMRNILNNIFNDIELKINKLNKLYSDMVKTHQDKKYIFGLDSFHFQNKLIQMEYENMKNIFNYIDNRIYCEYYKLHRMLYEYINKEITDNEFVSKLLLGHKKFIAYKDLETDKIYDFNITCEMHDTINTYINELTSYINEQYEKIKEEENTSNMGLNIHNMIHEQKYMIILLEGKVNMFKEYLNTFNTHHTKYFGRLTIKLKLMLGVVNEDIHLKRTSQDNILSSKEKPQKRGKIKKTNIDIDEEKQHINNEVCSPSISIDEQEENNVKLLTGINSNDTDLNNELDTIMSHIPTNDNKILSRRTIKKTREEKTSQII